MSRNAISTDLAPAWPYSPAGPVSSMTTPTVISQSAASAGAASAEGGQQRGGEKQSFSCHPLLFGRFLHGRVSWLATSRVSARMVRLLPCSDCIS